MIRGVREGIAWLFGYRAVPVSARGIFRRELPHMALWGVVWSSLNGGFCGYVARVSLDASVFLVSVIAASVALANLLCVWWAVLAVRRSPRRVLRTAMLAVAGVLGSFLFTPWAAGTLQGKLPAGMSLAALLFTGQVVLGWIALHAVNTVRTTIWKVNYPDSHRARVLARFAIWQMLVAVVWSAWMGAYYDGGIRIRLGEWCRTIDLSWLPGAASADAYRLLLPLGGVAALVALWFYRGVIIRERPRQTKQQLQAPDEPLGSGDLDYDSPGWLSVWRARLQIGVLEAYRVLRDDPRFTRYMSWNFLGGSATMMIQVPLVLILAEVFKTSYVEAAGTLIVVPQVATIIAMPAWARVFDHCSISRFRTGQMVVWAASRALLALGIWQHSLLVVCLALAASGVAASAGQFAWRLGHMAFSTPKNDALYLGTHQTLTGVRGLTMPFLGAALYLYVLGWHIIWMTAVLQGFSAIGFYRMAHGAEHVPSRAVRTAGGVSALHSGHPPPRGHREER